MANLTDVPLQAHHIQPYRGIPVAPELRIISAGYMGPRQRWLARRFQFDFHTISFIASGGGILQVGDGPPRRIPACSFFTTSPGQYYVYGPQQGDRWEEYYVGLNGSRIDAWRRYGWFPECGFAIPLDDRSSITRIFREFLDLAMRHGPHEADRAVLALERLTFELHAHRTKNLHALRPIDAVIEHCRQHFREPIDFSRLAKHHGMSYSKLRKDLKHATGHAPAHYLTVIRCEAARALLSATDMSIKAIGDDVGIDDLYVFSRTFKRCVGLSPRCYRQQAVPWWSRSAES